MPTGNWRRPIILICTLMILSILQINSGEATDAYETLSDPLKKENYDFLYRRVILQEFPRETYYPAYYEDPTPPDTRVYSHKYTSNRKRGNVNITGILVGILLVLQIGALIIKAAPVAAPHDPARSRNAGFPESSSGSNASNRGSPKIPPYCSSTSGRM